MSGQGGRGKWLLSRRTQYFFRSKQEKNVDSIKVNWMSSKEIERGYGGHGRPTELQDEFSDY